MTTVDRRLWKFCFRCSFFAGFVLLLGAGWHIPVIGIFSYMLYWLAAMSWMIFTTRLMVRFDYVQ